MKTMNSIELYKKLPRKNCGECRQKTCMPFALAVSGGSAELSECPYLDKAEIEILKGQFTVSDWREELILKLREEVSNIRFADVAELIGAETEGGNLTIKCMGRPFRVAPDGEVSTHGHITPWVKILLLHYIKNSNANRDSIRSMPKSAEERWISYSELKSGMVKASSFLRECEDPLRELFDNDLKKTGMVLTRLGAAKRGDFPTQEAWLLYLLPKVPAIILYWPADEEFPSKVKVLFDPYADRFLDVESMMFLVEGLVKNIEVLGANIKE